MSIRHEIAIYTSIKTNKHPKFQDRNLAVFISLVWIKCTKWLSSTSCTPQLIEFITVTFRSFLLVRCIFLFIYDSLKSLDRKIYVSDYSRMPDVLLWICFVLFIVLWLMVEFFFSDLRMSEKYFYERFSQILRFSHYLLPPYHCKLICFLFQFNKQYRHFDELNVCGLLGFCKPLAEAV